MKELKYFLLDIFFPPNADILADRFLKYNPYPEKDKLFIGHNGDVKIIIGSETFKNVTENFKEK